MANINKSANYAGIPGGWRRGGAYPLDPTEVYYSLAEAEAYAASDVTAYVGQKIVVVDETKGKVSHYSIQSDGTLEELGSATLGDDVSITLGENNVLSLHNFGKQYYKYVAPTNEGESGTYELTEGFVAGLQPEVRLNAEGTALELVWKEPNPETATGLQSAIDALTGTVNTMQGTVSKTANDLNALTANVYTKEEIDDKFAACPEWAEL